MRERRLRVRRLGRVEYGAALALQKTTERAVVTHEQPDTLLLLEHPHTLTLGRGATRERITTPQEILDARGVTVFETNRGGKATYHGLGQLVGYPVINLSPEREDVHAYVRDLEEVLMRALADFGIEGFRIKGLTGVHTTEGKVAALGVHIARWVTTHGFALNVNTDLSYFNLIIACEGEPVTSMQQIMGREVEMEAVEDRIISRFAEVFDIPLEDEEGEKSQAVPGGRPVLTYPMLTFELIKEAHARIAPHIHRTPVVTSRSFDAAVSEASEGARRVFFKCESLQRTGSFKIRGATNKILSLTEAERRRGVAAFSSGNHAQAVALAAGEAGVRAMVVMPQDAPQSKIAATRGYGAQIIFYDRQREDREEVARAVAEREGAVLVPPFDDYMVMAGQGTCALELFEDVPDLDCIAVPTSGGGLFAGVSTVAKAINPKMRCFPVEPESADDTLQSLRRGERVEIPPPDTIADGLRVVTPGRLTFPILQQTAEDVLTVSDEEITAALRFVLFRMKLLVEPSGAAAAGAVLAQKLPPGVKRIGVILSGGNIDAEALAQLLAD